MEGVGNYVGGAYVSPSQNVEYNRKLGLINTVKMNRSVDTPIKDIIEDAKTLEDFLLGR